MAEAIGAVEAVGLASSILTFLDVGYKVIRSAHEIYSSTTGATEENTHILSIVTDLEGVSVNLETHHLVKNDPDLVKLSKDCQALSKDLLKLLESLKPKSDSKLHSVKAAWSVMRSRKDVQSIEKRLGEYREQITLHLLAIFW